MGSVGICHESSQREVLMAKLTKGQDYAKHLQALLRKQPIGGDGFETATQYLFEILGSFEQGLFLAGGASDQIGRSPLSSSVGLDQVLGLSPDTDVCEGSDDSSGTKRRPSLSDKRGCYKRRKPCESRVTVTPTMGDGQGWRKYGQKAILNAKFPRSYFRCTHKYDQDCKATKQVQRMEDESGMYKTTYLGVHTCNRVPIGPPQLIIPDYPEPESTNFINLSSGNVKEETKDQTDTKSDLTADNVSFGSFQDHSSFPTRADGHLIGFEPNSPQDHGEDQDDISRMYRLGMEDFGAHSEMELLLRGSVSFCNNFNFDEIASGFS